jgi:hypothetical protein
MILSSFQCVWTARTNNPKAKGFYVKSPKTQDTPAVDCGLIP